MALATLLRVAPQPTLRDFAGMVWSVISNQTTRELKRMGRVRPELIGVVYSQLGEEEAADLIGDLVRSDPRGARATLAYVTRIRDHSFAYETDRAYRILRAAITNGKPEPVSPDNAELFERQKALGWSPLAEAFEQLAAAVPELTALARTVGSTPTKSEWFRHAEQLVGPDSKQSDPLLRSRLALTVVARYIRALNGNDWERLRRPVWASDGRTSSQSAAL